MFEKARNHIFSRFLPDYPVTWVPPEKGKELREPEL